MDQYGSLVFSICIKITGDYFLAEDITQETFLAAYRHYHEFDGKNEKAWISRIAANRSIDAVKKADNQSIPTPVEEMPERESRGQDPQKTVETKDVVLRVKEACSDLPESYREISIMYFINGMTSAEISEKTGINLSTVQTRIRRARELLKKSVRKEDLMT